MGKWNPDFLLDAAPSIFAFGFMGTIFLETIWFPFLDKRNLQKMKIKQYEIERNSFFRHDLISLLRQEKPNNEIQRNK